jgi:carbonic anhydrase/acetyltransferase-like protein (isoleucine patch superfamily)
MRTAVEIGMPKISRSAFVDRSAAVIGDVTIGDDVYIAPNASIRADEPGSKMIIGEECNVQDNAVLHAVSGSELRVGKGSTLAHGCIVHGPCTVGEGRSIGFGSVVFQSALMDGCVVMHRAFVHGATVPAERLIAGGAIIDGHLGHSDHFEVPEDIARFVGSVRYANVELGLRYRQGERRGPRDG